MIDSIEDAEAITALLEKLNRIANALEGLHNCVHVTPDGNYTLKIEIPYSVITHNSA